MPIEVGWNNEGAARSATGQRVTDACPFSPMRGWPGVMNGKIDFEDIALRIVGAWCVIARDGLRFSFRPGFSFWKPFPAEGRPACSAGEAHSNEFHNGLACD